MELGYIQSRDGVSWNNKKSKIAALAPLGSNAISLDSGGVFFQERLLLIEHQRRRTVFIYCSSFAVVRFSLIKPPAMQVVGIVFALAVRLLFFANRNNQGFWKI